LPVSRPPARRLQILGTESTAKSCCPLPIGREAFRNSGRITDLLLSSKLASDLGHPVLDPACDRVMVCGSQSFSSDMVAYLKERGFVEGSGDEPAHFVIEKAFVESKALPARSEDHG
jgi:ferredoxin--NADP+ reductase